MKRPDKNEIKELTSALKAADAKLSEAAGVISEKKRNIKTYYGALSVREIRESFKDVPIDDIRFNAEGINMPALKEEGIATLDDLCGLTREDLIKIKGIGEVMADKIVAARTECQNAISKSFVMTISAEDLKDVAYAGLITELYALIKLGRNADEITGLQLQNHIPIMEASRKAEEMESSIAWFFSSKASKTEQMTAYDELCAIRASGFEQKSSELLEIYGRAMAEAGEEEAIKAFSSNTAPFFALLEKICGKSAVKDEEQVLGLPEEVVKSINELELDTSLMKATLRPYQEFGTKYILNQQRSLLGDEMGLGKTMQSIAAMAHLTSKGASSFMVVCPVSVMVNWAREIEKHSLLKTTTIHGNGRDELFDEFIEKGGVAITTFETITRLDLEKLTKLDMLTVDEAHYVKNPQAQRTKALEKIARISDYCLLMTGTPLENRVEEMIFLTGLLRDSVANDLKSMIAVSKAPEFRSKIAPVYLRRVREDVLTELPEKIESEEWCELTPKELELYRKALFENDFMACRKLSYSVEDNADSAKISRILELCDQAAEEGRKIIIFSFYLSIINRVAQALGDRCFGIITGQIPSEERQDMIDRFAESPDGSVIVSQIIAGGVGLNIQCASVVMICEPQWKPSTENQAISRCYRMGQSRSVLVYRLLSADTIDERVMEILKEKSQTFDQFADQSEINQITLPDIKRLMEEEKKAYGITDSPPIDEKAVIEAEKNEQTDELTDDLSSIIELSENISEELPSNKEEN